MTNESPSESHRHVASADGILVAPSLEIPVDDAGAPPEGGLVEGRILRVAAVSIVLGVAGAVASVILVELIALITNFAFFQRLSLEPSRPASNQLGLVVVIVPVIGAIIVGFMARYGSKAIRGHGIPEAMEQVLTNESRVPARLTLLKPISAAISIGTGGPFGAEGPIIATGGALGSLAGQIMSMSATERKILLAAGAAAGMSATFGSPVAAVILAIELLLFEYRARSIIPVALAASTAAGIRMAIEGHEAVFAMPTAATPTSAAFLAYALIGALLGVIAVGVTRLVYAIEDHFERLPIHWMWWPAIGAVVVGIVGYFAPDTLGVGYYNITNLLGNALAPKAILFLCVMKLISWSVSLGSGTSGGTLAPLLIIGGGAGAVCGVVLNAVAPGLGIDPGMAALVGMGAIFSGATRAMLASVVFAFETTHQIAGLLPLLAGCTTAYLVSCLIMRHTIMTEKIARRGVRTPADYVADALDRIYVRDIASRMVVVLRGDDSLKDVRQWLASGKVGSTHQGFPIVDATGVLLGVLTRRDLLAADAAPEALIRELIHTPPKFAYEDSTARQAADHMARHGIGRLPVLSGRREPKVVGILSRSDIIGCFRRDIDENRVAAPTVVFALGGARSKGGGGGVSHP